MYFGHSTGDSKREDRPKKNRRLKKNNIIYIKIWMIT